LNVKIRHVGVVVKDLELWLAILVEDFKFYIWRDQIEEGQFISDLVGILKTKVRTVKLKDSNNSVIELLQFESPTKHYEEPSGLQPNSLGITHIALQVTSIDDAIGKLFARGFSPICAPLVSADGLAKVSYVRGPEKVLLEIVELVSES
jgi:hypothetical protein